MKIAVTGSSGYLGQLLVHRLVAEPEVDAVIGLDLAPPAARPPKLTHVPADVRTADFRRLLEGIDVLYHLAFLVAPPRRLSPDAVDAINVGGSRRVFEGALAAGVPRIVYTSSIAAYGAHPDNPPGLTETAPLRPNPDWYYSRTKGAVERLLDGLQQDHPEAIVVRLRPDAFIGASARNPMVRLLSGRWLFALRGGPRMSFSWDADIVEGCWLAARHDRSDVFNLAGEHPLGSGEIGRVLGKRVIHVDERLVLPLGRLLVRLGVVHPTELEWLAVGGRWPILASASMARRVLGWRPRYDTEGVLRAFATPQGH